MSFGPNSRFDITQPAIMHRLLSKRDKHKNAQEKPKQTSGPLHGTTGGADTSLSRRGNASKSQESLQQLVGSNRVSVKNKDLARILNATYAKGDIAKSSEMIDLLDKTEKGFIEPVQSSQKMLGAVNREGVSCYLDSLLFAMFATLDSYEAMLHQQSDDEPRKRLVLMLRLWVNLLRTGKLITTDITRQLQLALAACGWKEAAESGQQDPSEAYSFITDKLALPMLTLKVTVFHGGKEDAENDHKLVQERVIELPVPDVPENGQSITLEDCLAAYFDNQVEVERYLQRRRNTLSSVRSYRSDDRKTPWEETMSISESQPSTPLIANPQEIPSPISPSRRVNGLIRSPSLFSRRVLDPEKAALSERDSMVPDENARSERRRGLSLAKTEVKIPAFQFFNLIPWYTPAENAKSAPSTDSQVVDHFKSYSPIVPIALKWSQMDAGRAVRRDTAIDIPLMYDMPHFAADDGGSEDPLHGHFIMVLQGFLCHQGSRPDSGHYVSAARCRNAMEGGYQWILNDDLANPRISSVEDIKTLLKNQKPYLLFYQVEPISALGEPPAYSDSVITDPTTVEAAADVKERSNISSHGVGRQSLDEVNADDYRGRSSMTSERRQDSEPSTISIDDKTENRAPTLRSEASLDPQAAGDPGRRNSRNDDHNSNVRQNGRVKGKRSSMSLSRMTGRLTKGKSSTSPAGMAQPAQAPHTGQINAPTSSLEVKANHAKGHHSKSGHHDERRECLMM